MYMAIPKNNIMLYSIGRGGGGIKREITMLVTFNIT